MAWQAGIVVAVVSLAACAGAPTDGTAGPQRTAPFEPPRDATEFDSLSSWIPPNETWVFQVTVVGSGSLLAQVAHHGYGDGLGLYWIQRSSAGMVGQAFADTWNIPQFASKKEIDPAAGVYTETCLNGHVRHSAAEQSCPAVYAPRDSEWNKTYDENTIFDVTGDGWIVAASQAAAPVWFEIRPEGAPLLVHDAWLGSSIITRFGVETFDAGPMDIWRCADVGWCGTVESAMVNMPGHSNAYVRINVWALAVRAAVIELCIEHPDWYNEHHCLVPRVGLLGQRTFHLNEFHHASADGPAFTLSARGEQPGLNGTTSFFSIGAQQVIMPQSNFEPRPTF